MPNTTKAVKSRFKLRPPTRWLHTWGGIVLGGVVSVICLTGSVIVFRQEIEKARWPQSGAAAVASHTWSLDSAAQEIGRSQPGAVVTRVRFPATPTEPYIFQTKAADKRTHRVAVDSSTGQILGELPQTPWLDWFIDLHRNMLAGKPGRQAVGGIGIVSTALAATGLLLWLLGGGRWKAWVMVRSNGGPRRFNFDLHRASGLWVLVFLVVLSFTGIALSYPQSFRSAWEGVTGQPASLRAPKPEKTAKRQTRSLDEYLATARRAMPDGTPAELRISDSPKTATYMRLRRAGDLTPAGSNRVYIDPSSGKVLSTEMAANSPLGVQLFQAIQPVHYADFGGLPVKILWSIFGAIPALLFVTGLLVWWRPNKQKARPKGSNDARVRAVPQEDPIAEPARQ